MARASPSTGGFAHDRPGSAPRFSQPPSGFLGKLELAGLFHPAAVRATSFRALPSQGSRAPLEAALLPCGHPRGSRTRPPAPCRRRFPRRPRSRVVAWFPRRLWAPFPRGPEAALPVRPGRRVPGSPPAPRFTRFEALIPLRVRSRRPELPRADGRGSPGLDPPRACPPGPRHLPPPGPHDPSAPSPPEERGLRPRGRDTRPRPRADPRDQVGPPDVETPVRPRRRSSGPVWAGPRRLAAACLLP
jgi:hypothetical protein